MMKYRLQDLIDIDHFQKLQDRLNKIYSFPSAIIDNDGNILTATGWQDICTKFHRKNKQTERLCIKSDQYISDHIHEANPAVSYRCPHGLMDNATPIIIDGIHYGNFFTGQFFLEEPDLEWFRTQAQKYGFDEDAYIAAVKKVPVWTRDQLENYLFFIKGLIAVISESGMKKLKEIEHRKQIQKSEKRYRSILKAAIDGYWLTDTHGRLLEVNDAYCRMSGYNEGELLNMHIPDLEVNETPELVAEHMQTVIMKGSDRFETRHRRKDGVLFDVEVSIQFRPEDGGQCVCFLRDITERKRAEEALTESKAFLDNMSDVAYMADDQGNLLWVNPAAGLVTGLPRDEMIGKPFVPLFIQADQSSLIDVYKRTLAGESLQNTLTFKSGVTCHFSSLPKRNPHGDIVGTFGVARDISKQKAAERALQTSETRLKKAQAMAKVGNWEYDIVTGKVWGSEEAFRIYGIERTSEFLPLDVVESHIIDAKIVNQTLVDLVTRNKPYDIEFQIQPKNRKEWIHVHSIAEMVYDDGGTPEKVVGVIQDITERKHSENRIKSLERRNQALLDHSPVCHKIVDLDFNLQYMSANGFKMLKLDEKSDVYGKPYPFYFFPETFRNEMKKKLQRVIETGETITMEARTSDFQGNDVWLDSSLIPVFDDDRHIEYITVVSANVTQRARDEKEKARLEEQLRQAQKMEAVGRLAGGVAHDFNNMLGVILGHTELALLQADENQELYFDLKEIQTAATRSAEITKQLLAFARKQPIYPRKLDLNDTVESMLNMLRRLIGEHIDLVWQPAAHLWPVKMDPSQIDQILANLCINARDAIFGVGRLTIETGIETFDETSSSEIQGVIPGDFVLLAVSDNGGGMNKEILNNLFEPFFTTKEVGKGTGLGLATVYGIVKQNNGFIKVYSEPGQGSTFKIYLPRLVADGDIDKTVPEEKAATGGTETILLVEDEPTILRMTRMMLEKKGYRVLSAATPSKALEKTENHSGAIDLLMTDVIMPEMNGRDLAEKITDLYPDIRLLFMSGYTADIIAHQGILDEGVAFIQKPFSLVDLSKKVREILDTAPDKNGMNP